MIYRHIDHVAVTADFSEESGVRFQYRLEIVRTDVPPGKTACVVMQNPSYASEDIADKSVQFMEKNVFTRCLPEFSGVSRLIVVNQFARVQTNNFLGRQADVGIRNDKAITSAIERSDIVVIGWGSSNPFSDRQDFVLKFLGTTTGKVKLKTAMHPSRGRYDGFIQNLLL